MCCTGTGLVTSTGDSWKRQRALVGPAFRRDILEETAGVAKRAVDRLSVRLEAKRGTGEKVELAEEFRVMTLQVICRPSRTHANEGAVACCCSLAVVSLD
jgi:cytochrome P450